VPAGKRTFHSNVEIFQVEREVASIAAGMTLRVVDVARFRGVDDDRRLGDQGHAGVASGWLRGVLLRHRDAAGQTGKIVLTLTGRAKTAGWDGTLKWPWWRVSRRATLRAAWARARTGAGGAGGADGGRACGAEDLRVAHQDDDTLVHLEFG